MSGHGPLRHVGIVPGRNPAPAPGVSSSSCSHIVTVLLVLQHGGGPRPGGTPRLLLAVTRHREAACWLLVWSATGEMHFNNLVFVTKHRQSHHTELTRYILQHMSSVHVDHSVEEG